MASQLPLFPSGIFHSEPLGAECDRYLAALLAPQSRIGYGFEWRMFVAWAGEHGRCPLPASRDTVTLFLADGLNKGLKVSTVRRRLHAIAYEQRRHGFDRWDHSACLMLLRGAQRTKAERPRRMVPLTIAQLREISIKLGASRRPAAVRDRALMLLGFTSALRSVSLAELALDDVEFSTEGLVLTIRREKQDQEARGRYIGIPLGKYPTTCASQALRAWLDVRGETGTREIFIRRCRHRGALPMASKTVCAVVKRSVAHIGLNPSHYGAHSLRSGFITAAGEAGLSDLLIAAHSGHRDMDCLRTYFRRSNVFRANACAALDL